MASAPLDPSRGMHECLDQIRLDRLIMAGNAASGYLMHFFASPTLADGSLGTLSSFASGAGLKLVRCSGAGAGAGPMHRFVLGTEVQRGVMSITSGYREAGKRWNLALSKRLGPASQHGAARIEGF